MMKLLKFNSPKLGFYISILTAVIATAVLLYMVTGHNTEKVSINKPTAMSHPKDALLTGFTGLLTDDEGHYYRDIVADSQGNVLVAVSKHPEYSVFSESPEDSKSVGRIFKINKDGTHGLFVGSNNGIDKDGAKESAGFIAIDSIAIDKFDNLYTLSKNSIRRVSPDAEVSTVKTFEDYIFSDIVASPDGAIFLIKSDKDIVTVTSDGTERTIWSFPDDSGHKSSETFYIASDGSDGVYASLSYYSSKIDNRKQVIYHINGQGESKLILGGLESETMISSPDCEKRCIRRVVGIASDASGWLYVETANGPVATSETEAIYKYQRPWRVNSAGGIQEFDIGGIGSDEMKRHPDDMFVSSSGKYMYVHNTLGDIFKSEISSPTAIKN